MPIERSQRDPLDLQQELERAVDRNEFGVEYQPIIDLQAARSRPWRRSSLAHRCWDAAAGDYCRGEVTGLIVPIGERVLARQRAVRTGTWDSRGCRVCRST